MRVTEATEAVQLIDLLRHRIVTATEFIQRMYEHNIVVQSIRPARDADVTTNEFVRQALVCGPSLGLTLEVVIADEQCRAAPETCVRQIIVI